MPFPNNGLINETNRQYYAGAQSFGADGINLEFQATFDTDLYFGGGSAYSPLDENYALNNFKLYTSPNGLDPYTEYTAAYTVSNNKITTVTPIPNGFTVVIQLKSDLGGNYGDDDAYGVAVNNNYGGYSYITLNDLIDNFMVGYVGDGKIVQRVKKSDVLFHAKRGLQEFSYDTLKSIKSQELTIPTNLSIVIPQDYVNYVRMSYIDSAGVKRIIYPANNLTINPYENPVQDQDGIEIQSQFNDNIEGTSQTEYRWDNNDANLIAGNVTNNNANSGLDLYGSGWAYGGEYGSRYGLDPQTSQANGWFTINDRDGKISFSSNLVNKLIVLEYVSDGLAYDLDTRVPKMAEEAMYAHIMYSIVSTRANQPEYIVQRFKRDRSAKLRNAKIRLSNIKIEEITQVMRGKSKWIKH
jgi:hypothetical protein